MRKPYLDNLRWAAVVLVMLYHVIYMFNASGVAGSTGHFAEVQPQDALLPAVYPWFMVLLFVIAGISARYALQKYPPKEFLRLRTRKLLVPATVGLLALQWITGYFNMLNADAFDSIPGTVPKPILYFICALSGTGPLWFAQMLWLFSLLLLLLRRIDRSDRLGTLGEKAGIPVLLLLFLPMWGASFLLNAPVIEVYRFGIYGLAFLLGYEVFAHEAVQQRTEKLCIPLLIAAAGMGIAYVWLNFDQNYADAAVLKGCFTNAYMWCAVLAILGCGRKWFNSTNQFAAYMIKHSFGFYVLHYLPLSITAYYTFRVWHLPAVPCYFLTGAAVMLGTPLLCEVICRIPVVRWCVLGIKGK